MVFITKSNKIDEQEITSLYRLEGPALERKEARDRELEAIIKGEDQRILLVIGPCSSDNEEAVMDYARRLADLQEQVKDQIFIVMRVYTAKPRTNGDGYKGLMHQPDTHAAPSFVDGLKAVRHLHYRVITETGLTTADELLYPASLPYVEDLISYHAIGARSVEDQEHRFVSSGISAPTGMKLSLIHISTMLVNFGRFQPIHMEFLKSPMVHSKEWDWISSIKSIGNYSVIVKSLSFLY